MRMWVSSMPHACVILPWWMWKMDTSAMLVNRRPVGGWPRQVPWWVAEQGEPADDLPLRR
jgi:hypothetical protein